MAAISTSYCCCLVCVLGISNIGGALAVIITSLLTFDRTLFHSVCSLLYGAATIVTAFSVNKVSKSKKKFFFINLKDCRFNADKIKLITIGNNMSNL